MLEKDFRIASNIKLANDTYLMKLEGKFDIVANPGQYVLISLDNFFLRRPFAIFDCNDNYFTILYKHVGRGTKAMTKLETGTKISVLGPLGHGFPIVTTSKKVYLVSGGVGLASIYLLAKKLKENNIPFNILVGFNSKDESYYLDELKKLDNNLQIAYFKEDNLTPIDLLKQTNVKDELVYACGPLGMLKQIDENYNGYISLEARMGCGYGICNGCPVKKRDGSEAVGVCKAGPVFKTKEVIF